ncbi:MAG: hypothetical protein ACOCX6_02410 [bacterium]
MKRTTRSVFVILGFFILTSIPAGALDFDPRQYLESGDLNYTIEISFTGIDRYEVSEIPEEARSRREAIEENPGNPEIFVEYVEFLADTPFTDRTKATAENAMPTFLAFHAQEGSTQSADWLLTIANAAGSEERLNQAYNAVLDLLASREAPPEIVVKVMKNREAAEQPQTALSIGEDYLTVYPEDAELHFRTFLLTTRRSIHEVVPRQIRNTAQSVLGGGEPERRGHGEILQKLFFRTLGLPAHRSSRTGDRAGARKLSVHHDKYRIQGPRPVALPDPIDSGYQSSRRDRDPGDFP